MKKFIKKISACIIAAAMMIPCMANAATYGDMKGYYDGQTYENDFFGISVTLPDGFVYNEDAVTPASNGISKEATDDTDMGDIVNDNTGYTIMYAQNTDGTTVTFAIEKLSKLQSGIFDADAYIDAAVKFADQGFQTDQFKDTEVNVNTDKEICGKTQKSIDISTTLVTSGMEIPVYERMFAFKTDEYVLLVTAAASSIEDMEDVLNCVEEF